MDYIFTGDMKFDHQVRQCPNNFVQDCSFMIQITRVFSQIIKCDESSNTLSYCCMKTKPSLLTNEPAISSSLYMSNSGYKLFIYTYIGATTGAYVCIYIYILLLLEPSACGYECTTKRIFLI